MEIKLINAFNKQINHEFYSAYLYFAMSTYFDEIFMSGFSRFMKKNAKDKLKSAQKIYDYLILRDEKLTFSKIEEPTNDWINASDIFSNALSHEEFMLNQVYELYKAAKEENDVASIDFIVGLLKEQEKNVGYFRKLVFKIRNSEIISTNIQHLDYVMNKNF